MGSVPLHSMSEKQPSYEQVQERLSEIEERSKENLDQLTTELYRILREAREQQDEHKIAEVRKKIDDLE